MKQYELDEVIDKDTVDSARFGSLKEAMDEPWATGIKYRTIQVLEVTGPYDHDVILELWYQRAPDADWVELD